tara:strand:+ start:24 stop:176 length:153 start_codon:yes stop_codon:yes gene_type:complete
MEIINGEKRKFGKCDVEIKNKIVEPKDSKRRYYKNLSWSFILMHKKGSTS